MTNQNIIRLNILGTCSVMKLIEEIKSNWKEHVLRMEGERCIMKLSLIESEVGEIVGVME